MDAKRSRALKNRKEQRKLWTVIVSFGAALFFCWFSVIMASKANCEFVGSRLGLVLVFLCSTMGNWAVSAILLLFSSLALWNAVKEYRDYRYLIARHKKA